MVSRWQTCAWSAFYAIALLYLPGAYIWLLVRRREWSLRRYLLLPLVATAPIVASLVDAPGLPVASLSSKSLIGLAALAPVWAVTRLAQWVVQGRWRLSASWLAATLLVSAALGAAALAAASAHQQVALQPGERYRWEGWYSIWYYGAYATAWLMLAICLVWSVGCRLYGALRARRRSSASRQAHPVV